MENVLKKMKKKVQNIQYKDYLKTGFMILDIKDKNRLDKIRGKTTNYIKKEIQITKD